MAGRRAPSWLDPLLEEWARWVEGGAGVLGGGGKSLLARFMDTKGHIVFGGSSARAAGLGPEEREATVERLVLGLFMTNPMAADVLRLEHAAGWYQVAARRGLKGYDPRGLDQLHKADHLGISLRTYTRRLGEARLHLEQGLRP